MPPSDFANANVDEIVTQLTTDEAILLTAGVGFWHTHGVPRLGIPAIKAGTYDLCSTDISLSTPRSAMAQMVCLPSPYVCLRAKLCAGIRGNHFFMSTPAKCLPSATALGATWDTKLIYEAGSKLLAAEAKLRAAPVILAPTCNIQRVHPPDCLIFSALIYARVQHRTLLEDG